MFLQNLGIYLQYHIVLQRRKSQNEAPRLLFLYRRIISPRNPTVLLKLMLLSYANISVTCCMQLQYLICIAYRIVGH